MARDPDRRSPSTSSGSGSDADSERDPRLRSPLPSRLRYRPMGAAYAAAMEAVFAIAIATLAGWWLDGRFGTSPFGVLVGATIGFAAFVLRLYRLGSATYGEPQHEPRAGEPGAGGPEETSSQRLDHENEPEDDDGRGRWR